MVDQGDVSHQQRKDLRDRVGRALGVTSGAAYSGTTNEGTTLNLDLRAGRRSAPIRVSHGESVS